MELRLNRFCLLYNSFIASWQLLNLNIFAIQFLQQLKLLFFHLIDPPLHLTFDSFIRLLNQIPFFHKSTALSLKLLNQFSNLILL